MSVPSRDLMPAHGGQLRQIAARFGVPAEQLVDFSANINPAGPPPGVLVALQRALADPLTLTTYPDLDLTALKRDIAADSKVQLKNIAVANGFVPLLEAALRSCGIKRCLLPIPSFNEYRRVLENVGSVALPYRLSERESFAYRPDALFHALLEGGCDAILLANPQNPSGVLCEAEVVQHLIEVAALHGTKIFLDEAFIDYAPAHSLISAAIEQSNVIVFRSVTKFFAIPGLRVAYGVGNRSLISSMNGLLAPWPITSFAAEAVSAALQDEAYAEESRLVNNRRREWLERELGLLEIVTYPSSTNFLLLRIADAIDANLLWERMIVEEHVVLRSCVNFEGLASGHLRVAVRSQSENERLIGSLERTLRQMKE